MVNGEAGKGDTYRRVDPKKWEEGYERIYGQKRSEFFTDAQKLLIVCILILGLMLFAHWAWSASETCFSPYEDCEAAWVKTLDEAEESIALSCFGITNRKIGDKLLEKHSSGVKVLILEDKLMSKGKKDIGAELAEQGIEVVVKKTSALEHNKMAVIDGKTAIIGSWNLSGNAQIQDNSMVITDDENVVREAKAAMQRIYERDKSMRLKYET